LILSESPSLKHTHVGHLVSRTVWFHA